MSRDPIEFPLVNDSGTLADLILKVESAAVVAVDTEFVRERTYFPELCVLQLATQDFVAAIDCLAPIDLDPLLGILTGAGKSWLLHSARQDLEVLYYKSGRLPQRLIDTQIAAGLTGFPLQIGLKGLLEETIDISIGKQHTRADWSRRPLSEAMLQYALDDVRHLMDVWHWLGDQLESLSRTSWFEEECARQLAAPIEPSIEALAERTKGIGSLKHDERSAAFALLAWREERARTRNKPRRWILADDELIRIAKAVPASLTELKRVRDLPGRLVARFGEAMLSAIREREDVAGRLEPIAPDRSRVKSLQTEIRVRADALGIPPELLATRRDIGLMAEGRPPEIVTSGWRQSVLGDLIEIRQDPAS